MRGTGDLRPSEDLRVDRVRSVPHWLVWLSVTVALRTRVRACGWFDVLFSSAAQRGRQWEKSWRERTGNGLCGLGWGECGAARRGSVVWGGMEKGGGTRSVQWSRGRRTEDG